jgi:peroxiredoxin
MAASGLNVGDPASDFTAPLVSPEDGVEEVSLGSLLADRPVLLCFYTNDFSPDCIDEWCSFRDYQ